MTTSALKIGEVTIFFSAFSWTPPLPPLVWDPHSATPLQHTLIALNQHKCSEALNDCSKHVLTLDCQLTTFTMPKAARKAKNVETTMGKTVNGRPTFACGCIGGCKGHKRKISEAFYKKHAKFRELEDALQDASEQCSA